VVELDPDAAAGVADRKVSVQAAILDPKIIEVAQCLAGEVAELGMVPFGFKLGDDDDGQHHPVLGKSADSCRVRQQNAGVEYIGAPGLTGTVELRPAPGRIGHDGRMLDGAWPGRC
jgi:hypothetical protein